MYRKTIYAPEGMWLTDGHGFYKEITLGDWDNEDNYTKVSNEDKEAHEMAESEVG